MSPAPFIFRVSLNFLIAIAPSPPVEVALPAISIAVVKHTGHMGFSSLAIRLLSTGLGMFANAFVH
jgi:hypothetical protein